MNGKLESALKEIFEELSNQDRGAKSVSTHGIIRSLGIQSKFMMGIIYNIWKYLVVTAVCLVCVYEVCCILFNFRI